MSPRAPRSKTSIRAVDVRVSHQQAARFHRQRDRRRLRAMAVSLACAAFLVALVLGVVGLRLQQVRLSYRLDALRTARSELEETRNRLRVEQATLKSLARIEGKARAELGMVPPARDQVRLAREFVPAGAGLTSLAPLTAAVDPSAPRGPTESLR
jgi:cell division protein FtsL